jgi:hypothetical protein
VYSSSCEEGASFCGVLFNGAPVTHSYIKKVMKPGAAMEGAESPAVEIAWVTKAGAIYDTSPVIIYGAQIALGALVGGALYASQKGGVSEFFTGSVGDAAFFY